jgi:hypothetical protein
LGVKKRGMFYIITFSVLFVPCIYSQNQPNFETVSYYDWLSDKIITVRAVHIAWMETYHTISNPGTRSARLLMYMAWKPLETLEPNAQWSDWEIAENTILPGTDFSVLKGLYDMSLENWRRHPNLGTTMVGTSFNGLRMISVPSDMSTPYWFDKNNNLHMFWKFYAIAP